MEAKSQGMQKWIPPMIFTSRKKREVLFSSIALLLTLVSLTPLFLPTLFSTKISGDYSLLFKIVLLLIPIAAIAFCYRVKVDGLPGQKAALFIFLTVLAGILVAVHIACVDTTSSCFTTTRNHDWQLMVQKSVMDLSPGVIPHSYRFLPNSLVYIMVV